MKKLTKLSVKAILLVIVAAPATAGGLYDAVTSPAATRDWTGAYAGLQFETILEGSVSDPLAPLGGADIDGRLRGVLVGYRFDLGQLVLGGEIDYLVGSGEISVLGGPTAGLDYDRVFRAGVEAGFDLGRGLVYATAGYADIELTLPVGSISGDGYFYGLGVDFMASDRIIVGVELLHHEFSNFGALAPASTELDMMTLGARIGWKF